MSEQISQLLAEDAARIVHANFTGVTHPWWWERRIGGGLDICQELDPSTMASELSHRTGSPEADVRRLIQEDLDLEDSEPVTLTYEIPFDATPDEAGRLLRDRSATPHGLAANLYASIEEKLAAREA